MTAKDTSITITIEDNKLLYRTTRNCCGKEKIYQQGNLIEKTDAMGRTTTFFYNVSGNLTKVFFQMEAANKKSMTHKGM